jgi:hypothetical protein
LRMAKKPKSLHARSISRAAAGEARSMIGNMPAA